MKITVYNAKGGAGKTPISTNIALDYGFAIGTNEPFNIYESFIPDERLLALDLSESFPDIPKDVDIVFDLAGSISESSHSITSAIKQSDIIIVPIYNEIKSLLGGIGTLREINKINGFNGECVVVATKLIKDRKEHFSRNQWNKSKDYLNVQRAVNSAGFNYEVFPLKYSKAFDAIFEREQSISQMCESDPLLNYNFRDVLEQFKEIYNHINIVEYAK